MKTFMVVLLALTSLTTFAGIRSSSKAEVKTLTCVTSDMAPNVDIRVELGAHDAIVKLILFGNDVDEAPTDGMAQRISLADAKLLLSGTGIIPFYNENNEQFWLVLSKRNGTIAVPTNGRPMIYTIDNCRVY